MQWTFNYHRWGGNVIAIDPSPSVVDATTEDINVGKVPSSTSLPPQSNPSSLQEHDYFESIEILVYELNNTFKNVFSVYQINPSINRVEIALGTKINDNNISERLAVVLWF